MTVGVYQSGTPDFPFNYVGGSGGQLTNFLIDIRNQRGEAMYGYSFMVQIRFGINADNHIYIPPSRNRPLLVTQGPRLTLLNVRVSRMGSIRLIAFDSHRQPVIEGICDFQSYQRHVPRGRSSYIHFSAQQVLLGGSDGVTRENEGSRQGTIVVGNGTIPVVGVGVNVTAPVHNTRNNETTTRTQENPLGLTAFRFEVPPRVGIT